MTRRATIRSAGALAVASLLVWPAVALAQAGLGITIEQAQLDDDGAAEVLVSVSGNPQDEALPASAFAIREGDTAVKELEVTPVEADTEVDARTIMLLFDTSGSTAGEPIEAAKAAATEFVTTVTDVGVDVGLVTFSDEAALVQSPTGDATAVSDAIGALEADGETAFHDAVVVAARTLQNVDGQRTIVAFTDGADTVSTATLDGAVTAATTVEASVSAVALTSGDLDIPALRDLTDRTGGSLVEAANAADLQGAFGRVATTLTDQYVLRYVSQQPAGEFTLQVDVAAAGGMASDTVPMLSTRTRAPGGGEPNVVAVHDPGIFADSSLLMVALAALFVGVLIVLALVLLPAGDARVSRTLDRGLSRYRRGDSGSVLPARSGLVGRRAVELVEAFPKPVGYDNKVQAALDRAGWPLRASEFTTLRVLAVVTGALVGWGLFGNVVLGIAVGTAGWFLPRLMLEQRVAARQARFLSQLPDTLQLLAGSLKAGYGILQAVDTVVKEAQDPTAAEFRQVLTESRLGLPLEDSLEAMAERIDSDDFRWVTVAINIQRRVGGNLAELLETVADTLREREMVRRQIASLSAEGKLSAVILTALPIVLALYMAVVNPTYIMTLFTQTVGQIMVLGAIILMVLGMLWMRRIIDIDV